MSIFDIEKNVMKTSDYVKNRVDKLPIGYVFTYIDFTTDVDKREAIIKALNRMVADGRISKLSKGKYYKPKSTVFGVLEPDQAQIVKDLLVIDDKISGYITGYGIYNQLGLTTQVSGIIQIGKNETRPELTRGMYKVRFVKQKNAITKENTPLLQLLDAIRFVKSIPDATIDFLCKRFQSLLKVLDENDLNHLLRLALKYPPSTRALLGALLESIDRNSNLDKLMDSLNPITKYKLNISESILPTAQKWNIQ
jgi:hypothetical protein